MIDIEYGKLYKAPINDKDILSDGVFDEIFGFGDYIEVGHGCVLGGIDDRPYMLSWSFGDNSFYLKPLYKNGYEAQTTRNIVEQYCALVNRDSADQGLIARPLVYEGYICGVGFYYTQERWENG